jgi:DNA polymerase (family 10)
MVNKDIARLFSLLANLMELHGENAFKTKAYASAYVALRKWDKPIFEMADEEIDKIPGIGTSVSTKIKELRSTGVIDALEKLKSKTPEGIQQLLSVKGLGPKKVRVIWDELKIETPAELLYACNENRLIKLAGFGLKTQEDLKEKITYFLDSQDRYLYANIEDDLALVIAAFKNAFPSHQVEWVGEFAAKNPVINKIECLMAPPIEANALADLDHFVVTTHAPDAPTTVQYEERLHITVHSCERDEFTENYGRLTMQDELFEKVKLKSNFKGSIDESLSASGFEGLPVELFDKDSIARSVPAYWSGLIEERDIKGIIHNHSTYSDGMNTLEEMSVFVRDQGYAYFVICDHSRSAFYANGLSVERVEEQMQEIDRINQKLAPFKVFKGIESDILNDGSLDYEDEVLKKFDLIVASIHSNLRMDEAKAMSRLIKAIENPYTRILGHATGRLLLARQGYPIDHRKVIDACAANHVVIELNANPLRLDMDYKWMDYCAEKNVLVSINPDAHSRGQVAYVRYGVLAARKGGLKKESCLNALGLEAFEKWVNSK